MTKDRILELLRNGNFIEKKEFMIFKRGFLERGTKYEYKLLDNKLSKTQISYLLDNFDFREKKIESGEFHLFLREQTL